MEPGRTRAIWWLGGGAVALALLLLWSGGEADPSAPVPTGTNSAPEAASDRGNAFRSANWETDDRPPEASGLEVLRQQELAEDRRKPHRLDGVEIVPLAPGKENGK